MEKRSLSQTRTVYWTLLLISFDLRQVLQLFFRDYVHEWYCTISTDEGFLYDLRQTLQRALIAFANRLGTLEYLLSTICNPFFFNTLIPLIN